MKSLESTKKKAAFFRLHPENLLWIKERAIGLNQPFSYVIDRAIESLRKNEVLPLEIKTSSVQKVLNEAREKKIKKLRKLLS